MMRNLFRREKRGKSSGSSPKSTTTAPSEEPFPSGIKQLCEGPGICDVDVVFIHGLDGNREKTWTAKGASDPWPKALLPMQLPSARILTFGYDAYAAKWDKGGSRNRIGDHAMNLLAALASYREDEEKKDRPIIFVCHSLGGLVCKDALVVSKMQPDPHLHNIYDKTHAIAFLGTPHRGSDLAIWAERLLKSVNVVERRNLSIVGVLNVKSEVLERIHEAFLTISKQIEITCFHEELPTSIKGFNKIVVSKDSATIPGCKRIGIHRDHTQMTKFLDQQDPGFTAICGELRRWAANAMLSNSSRELVALASREKQGPKENTVGMQQRRQSDNSQPGKFVIPYLKNENFVGRTKILDELKARLNFAETNQYSQRRVSLFGLGGTGKTQIALAFVYWLRETNPEVSVFWVHASNPERFQQSFYNIAQEFQIPGIEDPKTDILLLVSEWLKKKDCGEWLMVLDNADDTELLFGKSSPAKSNAYGVSADLAQYLPECTHGALLITTRNRQIGVKLAAGNGSSMVEVGALNVSESKSLLQNCLRGLDPGEEEMRFLSSRLEQLPLALAQAASFIWEYDMTIEGYLELLSGGDDAVINLLSAEFETSARDREMTRAVAETWMISFQKIEEQNPLASELLSMMSFLDRQDITIEILQKYNYQRQEGPQSSIELKKSIGILKNFSLVTEKKNGSLDIHRLVQLVTRSWLVRAGTTDQFGKKALITISELYPEGEFQNRDVCRAYLAHALAVLDFHVPNDDEEALSKAKLFQYVGRHFLEEGKYGDTERMTKSAFEISLSSLGNNHPITLDHMSSLALVIGRLGRYKEAEELQIQALEATKRTRGEDHQDTLLMRANLASIFQNQGRYKEAEELESHALEAMKRTLGENHPHTLIAISNHAGTLHCQGQYEEAMELQIQVLEAQKRTLGEDHPDTLASLANLASTLKIQGQNQEAIDLECQVLEAQKRTLGEDHPDTLLSMANLAVTLYYEEHYEEAEELQIQALEVTKRTLGEYHPHTIKNMGNLALTLQGQGRYDEAKELQIRVLEAMKRTFGEDHPNTILSISNLARTFHYKGQYEKTKELEIQVLEARKRTLGEDNPHTLLAMEWLSYTLNDLGQSDKASYLMEACFQKRKMVLGQDHPDTYRCADILGSWGIDLV